MSENRANSSKVTLAENSTDSGVMLQQVLPFALLRGEAIVEKPQDLFIPPDALEVILEMFEGPLDLLSVSYTHLTLPTNREV